MRNRTRELVVAALLALLAATAPAAACSVCRCGDPTFNALGTNIYSQGQLRLAVDLERLEKEQGEDVAEFTPLQQPLPLGALEEEEGRESLRETRLVLTGSYAFSDRIQGIVRVPFGRRELSSQEESVSVDGLGDPEIYGLFRLWSSGWRQGVGRGSWVSLVAGVKTAWGSNGETREGQRLDEHVQPGTGSTDPFAGLSAVHLIDERSTLYGSFQIRCPGRNGPGYRYGDLALFNVGYERKLSPKLDAAVELNARDARRDEVDRDGEKDLDTGGRFAFLSPRLLVDLGRGLVARLAVQVPVYDGLNGHQKEEAVFNLGLTLSL
jgi:hypothetical protein